MLNHYDDRFFFTKSSLISLNYFVYYLFFLLSIRIYIKIFIYIYNIDKREFNNFVTN